MTIGEMDRTGLSSSNASGSSPQDELKADADRLKTTASDRASEEAQKQKSQAAQTARSASQALEKAASDLDDNDDAPSWLSSAFRETAKSVDRFAGSVDNRSPKQLGRDVSSYARSHSGSFLAASAAAGFVAARFLRAGADYRKHHDEESVDYDSANGGNRTSGMRESRFADETFNAQQRYSENREGGIR